MGTGLSNVVASQIKIHEEYGGVIPEIAAREHLEAVNVVVEETFKQAGVKPEDVTAFAGTVGPGLVGCLLVGLNATKKTFFEVKGKSLKSNYQLQLCGRLLIGKLPRAFFRFWRK